MTNRERLAEIKRVAPVIDHIKKCAKEIIRDTYDYHVDEIIDIAVRAEGVYLVVEGYLRGETYTECYVIPVEWFDEGFNYMSAYEELKRIEEEKRKRKEEEFMKWQKERAEKEEYKKYLELKKKYESKGAKNEQ